MSCVKLMRKDACGKIVKAPVETYYLRKNGEEFQLTVCKKCIKKVSETINLFHFSFIIFI